MKTMQERFNDGNMPAPAVPLLAAEIDRLKAALDEAELTLRDLAVDGANLSAVAADALARIRALKEKTDD